MNHATSHAETHADHHAVQAPAVDHPVHPIGIYLKVWGLLFVLSAMSYAVDYFGAEGWVRWFLIITFMLLKAGLIVAIFMHMIWERLALMYAILLPPLVLGTLIWLMWIESDYTFWTRILFLGGGG